MPTARELLEQADALMRRNRSQPTDDIPVLTDSVAELPGAQVVRQRGVGTHDDALAPAMPDDDDPIPTLTERVGSEPAADVAPEEGGEPSDWLQREAGEPSVTGDIPDSVLIVPPAEDASVPADASIFEDVAPATLRTRAHGLIAFDEITQTEEIEVVAPPEIDEPQPGTQAPAGSLRSAADEVIEEFAPLSPAPEEAFEETAPPLLPALNEALEELASPMQSAEAAPAFARDTASEELAAASLSQGLAMTPSVVEEPATGKQTLVPPSDPFRDDARWESVAEEIRMQVLQRIDIFTDTGLREQLAVRLQPIVDRASADLVATINQHVGELLRSYVAEAIEREIESWRRSH